MISFPEFFCEKILKRREQFITASSRKFKYFLLPQPHAVVHRIKKILKSFLNHINCHLIYIISTIEETSSEPPIAPAIPKIVAPIMLPGIAPTPPPMAPAQKPICPPIAPLHKSRPSRRRLLQMPHRQPEQYCNNYCYHNTLCPFDKL